MRNPTYLQLADGVGLVVIIIITAATPCKDMCDFGVTSAMTLPSRSTSN